MSGGAKQRYVYANDPSKVLTLNVSDSRSGWRDDKIPEMLGNRMWHGCTLANIDNEVSKILFITCQPPILNLRIRIFLAKICFPFFQELQAEKKPSLAASSLSKLLLFKIRFHLM